MKLTNLEIKAAKPKEKPYSLPDGHGIVLLAPNGGDIDIASMPRRRCSHLVLILK